MKIVAIDGPAGSGKGTVAEILSKKCNLVNIDPECAPLNYITGDGLKADAEYVMSNNFAFGGVNTSLVFKNWRNE